MEEVRERVGEGKDGGQKGWGEKGCGWKGCGRARVGPSITLRQIDDPGSIHPQNSFQEYSFARCVILVARVKVRRGQGRIRVARRCQSSYF